MTDTRTTLRICSTVKKEGSVELSLETAAVPAPEAEEVIVRVEAAPINPSDLGVMFARADVSTVKASGSPDRPVVTASLPQGAVRALAARVGQAVPVGNEGAGVVVEAGSSAAAQALLGKTVAAIGGGMYSRYRCLKVSQCLVLPEGTTPAEGASCFVNPLTALGMVDTMRLEGHKALVHTAAASNLGQMLQKLCLTDGVGLVNIVRKKEQEEILRAIGAVHVCNSTSPTFVDDLTEALVQTGATLGFDAIGGGSLADQILTCMEAAATRSSAPLGPYGSTTHKQVYIYGALDTSPTVLKRGFGFAWGVGGWLLTPFLQRIGPAAVGQLRERVAAGIKTTFASTYTKEVSLAGALALDAVTAYASIKTGEKYLINPSA